MPSTRSRGSSRKAKRAKTRIRRRSGPGRSKETSWRSPSASTCRSSRTRTPSSTTVSRSARSSSSIRSTPSRSTTASPRGGSSRSSKKTSWKGASRTSCTSSRAAARPVSTTSATGSSAWRRRTIKAAGFAARPSRSSPASRSSGIHTHKRVTQAPPASGRVRRAGARLRVGDPRLRGRLADRPPHGRHERRLGLEVDERGVPAPEIGAAVPRLHGVRHARVGVRGEGPRGDVRRLLVGPASERRVHRIRHPAERLGRQAGESGPRRAAPRQHQRLRRPVRAEAVHGALQRRLGLVFRGPEGGTSADRVIGTHRRKRALFSRSASIKIENRIGEELIAITESRAMREKDVSRLLTDEYAERILVATQITSRSVQEISDKYDIPIAACYRKIHELEEAGFLNVAQIVTTPKGKTMKLYRSLLKSAQLVYQEGIFKVKFEFDVEKEI